MTGPLCVIVNYKTPDLTIRSLDALVVALAGLPGSRVIVVDNDSRDGSYDKLARAIEERGLQASVELVASPKNGGFGYGCNIGIARNAASATPAKYVYILNSDAFPEPDAVRVLVDFMEAHPRAGFIASCVIDRHGNLRHPARRFPTIFSEFDRALRWGWVSRRLARWHLHLPPSDMPIKAEWVGGVSMMLRKEALDEVGGFDEGFFLYFEETDLMYRAAKHGWETWLVPASKVSHVGSASTGMTDLSRPTPAYWFQSRDRFFRKAYGGSYLVGTNLLWVAGFAVWRVRRVLQRKPDTDPRRMLVDFIRHSSFRG